jgi:hypothetical protein
MPSFETALARQDNRDCRRWQESGGEVQAETERARLVRSRRLPAWRRSLVSLGRAMHRAKRAHRPARRVGGRGPRFARAGQKGQRQQHLQEKRKARDHDAKAEPRMIPPRAAKCGLSAMSRCLHGAILDAPSLSGARISLSSRGNPAGPSVAASGIVRMNANDGITRPRWRNFARKTWGRT